MCVTVLSLLSNPEFLAALAEGEPDALGSLYVACHGPFVARARRWKLREDPHDAVSDFLVERLVTGPLPIRLAHARRPAAYLSRAFNRWLADCRRRELRVPLVPFDVAQARSQQTVDDVAPVAPSPLPLVKTECDQPPSALEERCLRILELARRTRQHFRSTRGPAVLLLRFRLGFAKSWKGQERSEGPVRTLWGLPARRDPKLSLSTWVEQLWPWTLEEESLAVPQGATLAEAWRTLRASVDDPRAELDARALTSALRVSVRPNTVESWFSRARKRLISLERESVRTLFPSWLESPRKSDLGHAAHPLGTDEANSLLVACAREGA